MTLILHPLGSGSGGREGRACLFDPSYLSLADYHLRPISRLFSITFRLLASNWLCFQRHSRFFTEFSTAILCFHRHSRIVPLIRRNSLSCLSGDDRLLVSVATSLLEGSPPRLAQSRRWVGTGSTIAPVCSRQGVPHSATLQL
jgi:hypothetical protein